MYLPQKKSILKVIIAQSVLGISVPIETYDKVNWRTMNLGINFQAQYNPIPTIIYPWTRFERSLVHQKRQFQEHGTYVADKTRQFAYSAVEILLDRYLYNKFGFFKQKVRNLIVFSVEG